jgi:hypothetical protein
VTRFISDDERDALEHAQSKLARDNAEHARLQRVMRAFVWVAIALLAITAAAFAGWYLGGSR